MKLKENVTKTLHLSGIDHFTCYIDHNKSYALQKKSSKVIQFQSLTAKCVELIDMCSSGAEPLTGLFHIKGTET